MTTHSNKKEVAKGHWISQFLAVLVWTRDLREKWAISFWHHKARKRSISCRFLLVVRRVNKVKSLVSSQRVRWTYPMRRNMSLLIKSYQVLNRSSTRVTNSGNQSWVPYLKRTVIWTRNRLVVYSRKYNTSQIMSNRWLSMLVSSIIWLTTLFETDLLLGNARRQREELTEIQVQIPPQTKPENSKVRPFNVSSSAEELKGF